MSFYFNFTTLEDTSQLRSLIDFMASQDLSYPRYDEWLQRTESQLDRQEKKAILAFSEGRLVGNLVHQECRDSGLGLLREIKNVRIHPEVRGRYFMQFMLQQLYRECRGKYVGLIGDVRGNKKQIIDFFENEGFMPIASTSLYETGREEVTLFRPLRKEAGLLAPKIRKIIVAKSI